MAPSNAYAAPLKRVHSLPAMVGYAQRPLWPSVARRSHGGRRDVRHVSAAALPVVVVVMKGLLLTVGVGTRAGGWGVRVVVMLRRRLVVRLTVVAGAAGVCPHVMRGALASGVGGRGGDHALSHRAQWQRLLHAQGLQAGDTKETSGCGNSWEIEEERETIIEGPTASSRPVYSGTRDSAESCVAMCRVCVYILPVSHLALPLCVRLEPPRRRVGSQWTHGRRRLRRGLGGICRAVVLAAVWGGMWTSGG